jgi:hypothetical protein
MTKMIKRRGCWEKCPECGAPEGMWCYQTCIFRTDRERFIHMDLGVWEKPPRDEAKAPGEEP